LLDPLTQVIPKPGSTFLYEYQGHDSVEVAVLTVKEVGLAVRGRSDVSRLQLGTAGGASWDIFLNYLPTGDFEILSGFADTVWVPQPIRSRRQIALPSEWIHRYPCEGCADRRNILVTPTYRSNRTINGHHIKEYEVEEILTIDHFQDGNGLVYTSTIPTIRRWSNELGMFTFASSGLVYGKPLQLVAFEIL
jgi:hypothetical protein